MNNQKINSVLWKQFLKECKVFDLRVEYGNEYKGEERYAIASMLTKDEIQSKYSEIINSSFDPFLYLTEEQGSIFTESQNDDAKVRMRQLRFGSAFEINDGEFEVHHPEVAVNTDLALQLDLKEKVKLLRIHLNDLTEIQRKRIIAYFYEGKSYTDIAREEGTVRNTVKQSILSGIKKLKKFF